MCLPYSGKLSRKKTLVENAIFANKTFVNCSLVLPKDTTPPNFAKTFTNSHKTLKFAKVFSLKVPTVYGILQSDIAILVTTCMMLTIFSQLVRADFIDNGIEL